MLTEHLALEYNYAISWKALGRLKLAFTLPMLPVKTPQAREGLSQARKTHIQDMRLVRRLSNLEIWRRIHVHLWSSNLQSQCLSLLLMPLSRSNMPQVFQNQFLIRLLLLLSCI